MNAMEIKLKTLTPLWTGGVNTEMDRIHESGIIGSLRWWYEAIVRGLGGDVCDPILEQRCDENHQCDVCRLFGATGRGRRFRLSFTMHEQQHIPWNVPLNIRPHDRHRGWYIPPGWAGTITVQLNGDNEEIAKVGTLLLFLEQWGGIGAKQSLGYGRFMVEELKQPDEMQTKGFSIESLLDDNQKVHPHNPSFPNINDFLFYRVQFRPRRPENWWIDIDGFPRREQNTLSTLARLGMVPVSPVVKNFWRFRQQWASRSVEEWLFGKMDRSGKQQSRLSIGWAIRKDDGLWEIPGWAWLPRPEGRELYQPAETLYQMKKLLSDHAMWIDALQLGGNVLFCESITKSGQEIRKEL